MAGDREVWGKMPSGDAESFDVFYRETAPRLQAFLRQIVGSREAAEDIAHETYIRLWTRPHAFDPQRGTLRAYLFGIARKRAADWWRTQTSTESLDEDAAGPCNTEIDSAVSDAFRRLPEQQRTLLWLREVEGQSYAELSQILEIPIGTVRSRLFAAREALRAVWQQKR
ncbi:MAG TPA: RNA polymerase sigma factor [Acidisarcina sp.]